MQILKILSSCLVALFIFGVVAMGEVSPVISLDEMNELRELLVNGGFESNSQNGAAGYKYNAAIDGWSPAVTNKGFYGTSTLGSALVPTATGGGGYAAFFQVQGTANISSVSLSQTITNRVEGDCRCRFFAATRRDGDNMLVRLFIDNVERGSFLVDNKVATWFEADDIYLTEGEHTFTIHVTSRIDGDHTVAIYAISLESQPLPYPTIEVTSSTPVGVPFPSYGLNYLNPAADILTFTFPESWTSDDGESSLASVGYKLFKVDEVSGRILSVIEEKSNAYSGTLSIPDSGAYRLEWIPSLKNKVSVTAGDGGSLTSVIDGLYSTDSKITTTALPYDGMVFRRWTGDLPDYCNPFSPTLSFVGDKSRNITAVFSKALYVSPDGSDSNDGSSLDSAFLTIQAAIAAAKSNEVIFVASGSYSLASTIAVTKPVLIRGATDSRDDVVLDAQQKRTAIKVTCDGAAIAYLTVANGSANKGGGIWLEGYGEIRACRITGCVGPRLGSGAGVYNNNGKVIDCVIDNCYTAYDLNTGVALYQGGASAVTDRCIIRDNHSSIFQSTSPYKTTPGVYLAAGLLRNSVIAHNSLGIQTTGGTGGAAAGVYIAGGSMANCAIFGNSVFSELAGTQNSDFSAVHQSGGAISNCVISANTFHGFDKLTDYRGNAAIYYSALSSTNGIAGVNLIEVDDTLLSYNPNATPCLHLDMNSPLIDAGANSEWMPFSKDLNGNLRAKNGTVDIGPVEYQNDTFDCGFSTDRDISSGIITPFSVTFTPYVNCDEADVVYYWRIVDSSGEESLLGPYGSANKVFQHTFDEGTFDVTLIASNEVTAAVAEYTTAAPIRTRHFVAYVDAASTNPVYPYSTPETAAKTIKDALINSVDGLVVSLLPGEHLVNETVVIDSAVTVRGASSGQSVVKGDGSGRIFRLRHPKATLDNILIKGGHINTSAIYPGTFNDPAGYLDNDGYHRGGGGAVWIDCGGIVTNCIVEACTGVRGASALGIFNHGGVVSHTVFRNFDTTVGANNYGIVIRSYMRGLFTHCVISNINVKGLGSESPTGVADIRGGELRNSLITDCHLSWSRQVESNTSGVLLHDSNSRMSSCTVTDNSVSSIYGAAVRVNNGARVINSVIVNNSNAAKIDDWSGDGAKVGISYTMTSESDDLSGEGNIGVPSNVFWKDTFGITIGSPAIGAGLKEDWMTSAFDLSGEPRLEENGKLTLGAFAYNPPEYGIDWSHNIALEAFERVNGTISVASEGFSDAAVYSWYIDDVFVGDGTSYELDSNDYGKHILKLVVTEGEHTSEAEAEFYVIPKTIYVAEGNEGVFPYATWETACGNLSTAIGSAEPTATILVSDGTYQLTAMHNIVDPIKIRSVNGPYKTTIKAKSGSRHFYIDNPEILIEGFTLTGGGGANFGGGAGSIYNIGGTIRNCRFTNNLIGRNTYGLSIRNEGGHIDGCEFYGALIGSATPVAQSDITYGQVYQTGAGAITERCIFRDNVFRNRHQGHHTAVGVHLNGGIVRISLFYNNRWSNGKESAAAGTTSATAIFMTAGTVENCTFVNNQSCVLDPTAPEGTTTDGLGKPCASSGVSAPSLSAAASIVNCIFVDNTNSLGVVSEIYAKDGVAVNCRVDELTDALRAQGCIGAEPQFRNRAANDYRISSGSPCGKAGLYRGSWMENALDLAGKPLVRGTLRAPLGCYGVGYPSIFMMR